MSSKVDCKVVLLGRSYAGKTCLTTRFLEGYFYANQVPYRTVDMKVVLLGREYGGKTSLVERFMYDRFAGAGIPYQATIGAAFGAKKVNVNGENVMLGIWDTAGSERYEAMSRIYYRGACAAIVCYDLTDADSWQRTQFWVKELQQNEEDCKIYLCGTKKDLVEDDKHRRKVDYHTVTDYADEINAKVFETSSKTGEKIVELFEQIAQDYITDPKVRSASLEDTITPMDERSSKRGGGGCCGR